jgi:hypothetical protein
MRGTKLRTKSKAEKREREGGEKRERKNFCFQITERKKQCLEEI